MKIITWNVNGIRAAIKKGFFDYVAEHKPDVLCVQETKAWSTLLEPGLLAPPGYRHTYHDCAMKKGYSGVATFTREEPVASSTGFCSEKFDCEGRVVETDFGDFVLFNVYFPNGGRGPERVAYKLEFYDELFAHCTKLRQNGRKIIVCGDYNTAHQPIDLARPKENVKTSGFMPEERVKLDWLEANNWVDSFRMFNKEGGNYTYWDQQSRARDRNVGWRIDYHWITDSLVDSVVNAYHQPDVMGSDHCPVVIEIK